MFSCRGQSRPQSLTGSRVQVELRPSEALSLHLPLRKLGTVAALNLSQGVVGITKGKSARRAWGTTLTNEAASRHELTDCLGNGRCFHYRIWAAFHGLLWRARDGVSPLTLPVPSFLLFF